MLKRQRKRPSTSVLLILSGIDMLSASLVCSVVLFVVLVGGQAGDGAATGSSALAAPALLDVYWPQGVSGPTLSEQSPPADHDTIIANPDPMYGFLGSPLQARYYVLGGAKSQLNFTEIHRPFALVFYPPVGARVRILVGCVPIGQRMTITFFSDVRFEATCAPHDVSVLQLPAHARIRLPLPDSHALPGWQVEQPASRPVADRKMAILHPKADTTPPLLASSRIVQVLE